MEYLTLSGRRETFTRKGFTLIELLVVLAILATLLTIAVPRYFASVDRAKEAALRQNLAVLRDAIDKYQSDHGEYPSSLGVLAEGRYIRFVPEDPITQSKETWVLVKPRGAEEKSNLIFDVRSGASGLATSGEAYGAL